MFIRGLGRRLDAYANIRFDNSPDGIMCHELKCSCRARLSLLLVLAMENRLRWFVAAL